MGVGSSVGGGVGGSVAVGAGVGVGVGVGTGVAVGCGVAVGTGVAVGCDVAVGTGVAVAMAAIPAVTPAAIVAGISGVGEGIGVAVGTGVSVGDGWGVSVGGGVVVQPMPRAREKTMNRTENRNLTSKVVPPCGQGFGYCAKAAVSHASRTRGRDAETVARLSGLVCVVCEGGNPPRRLWRGGVYNGLRCRVYLSGQHV